MKAKREAPGPAVRPGAGDSRRGAGARGHRWPSVRDAKREGDRVVDTAQVAPNHEIAAVTHGFRSSFRDWAAEETDHPREVIEAALAHVVQNKVEAAYARSDLFDRRRLMDDWAGYLNRHADELPGR